MTTIEIFERKTGTVLETKEIQNVKGFQAYWAMQCDNVKYGYRIVAEKTE